MTILFCDVVGSTAVAERLDPESVRTLMSMFFFAARSALEAQGGTVEKFVGDAVLAAFGVPTLHEDDAVRAVRAALDVRAAVNELNARFEQSWGVRIGVRIGVNTGEVVAGDPALRQSFVSGDAVNVAARLEQAAGAGEILIGVETQRLTRAAVRMEQIAPLALRGKSGDVRAWRVLGPAVLVQDTPRRPPAPMVGRQRELARLQAAFEQTEEQRHCRLVTVIGSPGIGKSTLVEAFLGWAAGRATALGGRCLPYGEGITFWPIAEVVRVAARLDPQDGAEAASAKLTVLLAAVKDAGAALDAVVGLLGLGAATAREETFWAVRTLLGAIAAPRPLVVVLDDLHWAEPTMLDLVEHLRDWGRGAALLVLVVARPELQIARGSLTVDGPAQDCLRLEPLSAGESRELAAAVAGRSLERGLLERVVSASEGNPLFVGEILRMLIYDRQLPDESLGDQTAISIPPTIQALLAARLDRLADGERTVIERAAVVGKQFFRGPLAELSPPLVSAQLDRYLDVLVGRELVTPDLEAWDGEPTYRFAHLLIRDAAYHRLLKRERADLHERMAGWLESRPSSLPSTDGEDLLGYHLEQAHSCLQQLGRLDEHGRALGGRAATRLSATGRRALARGDHYAAAVLFERAARCLVATDPARLVALLDLNECLIAVGDVSRSAAVVDELTEWTASVRGLLLDGGPLDGLLAARSVVAQCELRLLTDPQRLPASVEELGAAIDTLTTGDNRADVAQAHSVLARTLSQLGRLADAERHLDRALVQARLGADTARARQVLLDLPFVVLWGPLPVTRASGRMIDTLRVLRLRPGNRAVEAEVLRAMAVLEAMRGRIAAARSLLASTQAILTELGLPIRLCEERTTAGLIELMAGEPAAAELALRAAQQGFARQDASVGEATAAAWLAESFYQQQRWPDAARYAEAAAEAGGDKSRAAAVWQGVLAKLAAHAGETAQAEQLARAGVASVDNTDALVDRADALMNLAEVQEISGRRDQARAVYREAVALYDAKGCTVGSARATRGGA